MDDEYRQQLRQELNEKRRVLHVIEMRLARSGIDAPPGSILDAEDLRKEIAGIESRLGIEWPKPKPVEHPRYAPQPAPLFEREVASRQEVERQRSIKHELEMLSIHRRNLKHYRWQQQMMGVTAPPIVSYGIGEAQRGIQSAKEALRNYGVTVDDLAGDE